MLKKGFGALLCSAFLISIQAFAQEDFKSDGTAQAQRHRGDLRLCAEYSKLRSCLE